MLNVLKVGILIVASITLIGNYVYWVSPINVEDTQKLEGYIESIKETKYENKFLENFNHEFKDGKISNIEFYRLENSYNSYILADISKNEIDVKNVSQKEYLNKDQLIKIFMFIISTLSVLIGLGLGFKYFSKYEI